MVRRFEDCDPFCHSKQQQPQAEEKYKAGLEGSNNCLSFS
jgi:hypothetical protein